MDEELIQLDFDPFSEETVSEEAAQPRSPASAPGELIPLDYDPFGPEGSFVPEAGKALARGTVSTVGGMVKGVAGQMEAGRQGSTEFMSGMVDTFDRIDSGNEDLSDIHNPEQAQFAQTYIEMPLEKRKEFRAGMQKNLGVAQEITPPQDITQSTLFQAGKATQDWSEEQLGAARDYEDSWTATIGEGLGSIAPYLATAFLSKGVGTVTGAAAGSASSTGEAMDRAIQEGATEKELLQAIRLGKLPGLTEQVPIETLFAKVPLPQYGKLANAVVKILSQAFVEGGQEGVQQVAQNMIEKFTYNGDQTLMEDVWSSAGIGAIVGGIVATPAAPFQKQTAAKTTADTASPPGLDATPEVPGVGTPGGVGVTPPPPAKAPSAAPSAPAEPVVTVVAPGEVDPTLAAALPSVEAVAAAFEANNQAVPLTAEGTEAVVTAAKVATGAVPQAPASVAGVIPEETETEEEVYDVDEEEEPIPGPTTTPQPPGSPDALSVINALREKGKLTEKAADKIVPSIPGGDLAAAIAATQPIPQAAPQAALQVVPQRSPPPALRPEPAGTAEAAARRAQPQQVGPPSPPTVVETPPALVPAPIAEKEPVAALMSTASPVEDPARAYLRKRREAREAEVEASKRKIPPAPPVQQEPVGALPTVPAVQAQPTAPPVQATLPAVQAPKIQELPPANMVSRALEGRLYQEFANDLVSEHPRFREAVEMVSRGMTQGMKKGVAPARAVEEALPEAIERLRSGLVEMHLAEQKEAAQTVERQHEHTVKVTEERTIRRETKEKPKPAKASAKETPLTTMRRAEAEMKKPEAERDPDLAEYHTTRMERKTKPTKSEEHKELTVKLKVIKDRRVARLASEEEARKPASVPAVVKPGLTPGTDVDEHVTKEHEDQEQVEAKAKSLVRTTKTQPVLATAIEAAEKPNFDRVTMAQMKTLGRAWMQKIANGGTAALKGMGIQIRDVARRGAISPEEALVIFAKKQLRNEIRELDGGVGDFMAAYAELKTGRLKSFWDIIGTEQMEGTVGSDALDAMAADQAPGEVDDLFRTNIHEGPPVPPIVSSGSMATPFGKTAVVFDENGDGYDVDVLQTNTSDEMIRDAMGGAKAAGKSRKGLYGMIRDVHVRRLRQMVGNVPMHFIRHGDIHNVNPGLAQAPAFYTDFSPDSRASGSEPAIIINIDHWRTLDYDQREDLLVHEMTHAATSFALRHNLRITGKAANALYEEFKADIEHRFGDMIPHELRYGLKNVHEFFSEAFSNEFFQQALMDMEVNPKIARWMSKMPRVGKLTYWDLVVDTVANALGMRNMFGRGRSYFDQVMLITPHVQRSAQRQFEIASEMMSGRPGKFRAEWAPAFKDPPGLTGPDSVFEMRPMVGNAVNAIKGKAADMAEPMTHQDRSKLAAIITSEEMKRQSSGLWGGAVNDLTRLVDWLLAGNQARKDEIAEGDKVTSEVYRLEREEPAEYRKLVDIAWPATQAQIDPSDRNKNKHVKKTGFRDAQRRAELARLQPLWAALSPRAKKVWHRAADHFTNVENERVRLTVFNAITNHISAHGLALPTGEDVDTTTDWVISGDIDKPVPADPANRQPKERSLRDDAMHTALGKHAESLSGVTAMRKIRGTYLPLVRWGKYFVSATHDIAVPASATLDPAAKDKNVLVFDGKTKDYETWAGTTDELVTKVVQRWVDPLTGATTKQMASYVGPAGTLVHPIPLIYATVQNRLLEMNDSKRKMVARQKQLAATPGFHVNEVATVDRLHGASQELLPQQINRLVNSVDQSKASDAAKKVAKASIVNAHIRQMAGSRAAHRRLPRANVSGFSRDLTRAMHTATRTMAGHLSNLRRAPSLNKLTKAARDYVDAGHKGQYPSGGDLDTVRRLAQLNEVERRIDHIASRTEDTFGDQLVNNLMAASFLKFLATPSYYINNSMQVAATSYPMIASHFDASDGMVGKAIFKAYRKVGGLRLVGGGLAETGRSIKHSFDRYTHPVRTYHEEVRARLAAMPNGPVYTAAMDELRRLGFGAGSGTELPDIGDIDRTLVGKVLDRTTRVARALAEATEAVNRYVTMVAAIDVGLASGVKDHAELVRRAVTLVEKSQGGYNAENNPRFMNNKYLKLPFQFKKYALMYGQAYYGALMHILPRNDPKIRKLAAKELARLSAMTVLFAGVGGLPMMELARVLVMTAAAIGLDDDSWEDWENSMQGWYAKAFEVFMSDATALEAAETLSFGLSRMLGFDTSSRLGNDAMLFFGEPRKYDEMGIQSWILDLMGGAPWAMIADAFQAVANGQLEKFPMPKMFSDLKKAYDLASEGKKTPAGRELMAPIGIEAVWQAIGYRPATVARQFEAGGSGAKHRADQKMSAARTNVMGEWANARPSDRQRIWHTTVAAWNREHSKKGERIDYASLQRSLRGRQQQELKAKRDALMGN